MADAVANFIKEGNEEYMAFEQVHSLNRLHHI